MPDMSSSWVVCVYVYCCGVHWFSKSFPTPITGEKVSLWFFGTLVCWWPNGLCPTFEYQIERLKWVLARKSRLPLHHGLLVLMMLMSIRFCSYPTPLPPPWVVKELCAHRLSEMVGRIFQVLLHHQTKMEDETLPSAKFFGYIGWCLLLFWFAVRFSGWIEKRQSTT